MIIHHHSCKCGWTDLDWCQVPMCTYPETSDVCPLCCDSGDNIPFPKLLFNRALLGLKIQHDHLPLQSEYDNLQALIIKRSQSNLHSSHVERMSK